MQCMPRSAFCNCQMLGGILDPSQAAYLGVEGEVPGRVQQLRCAALAAHIVLLRLGAIAGQGPDCPLVQIYLLAKTACRAEHSSVRAQQTCTIPERRHRYLHEVQHRLYQLIILQRQAALH